MYTKEEQAENRKKWVSALRSGNYQQGTEALRNGDEYCCLGVACDISGLGKWANSEYIVVQGRETYSHFTHLPSSVKEWLGLLSANGAYRSDFSLIMRNDDGDTFLEIADIIESEPEDLLA